jgi:hypothetical protein
VDEGVFKRGSCKCNEPEGNRKKSGQAALAFRQIGAFIVFQECLAQLVMIENVRDCGVFASRKFPALRVEEEILVKISVVVCTPQRQRAPPFAVCKIPAASILLTI